MKSLKNEKGAITLVVLVSMLFLVSFLMSAYIIVSNRAQKQKEISNEIQQIYSNKQDLNEIYNSYFNNEIIPIYTVEQLLKIGSGEKLLIDNKYCEMVWTATYALMNDLEFDVNESEVYDILGGNDWIPINNNDEFKEGYFEGNGYTITVTGLNGEVIIYSALNNYSIQPEIILGNKVITKEITTGEVENETLTAELKNATGILTWESSNPDVAEITGVGNTVIVTFKSAGTAIITASYESYKATCKVEVTEIEAET